jgi:hypothetical protein
VPEPIVTVLAPEAALKKTISAAVGTETPPAPPEVADHLVPAVASHVAFPPTQYLLAIICIFLYLLPLEYKPQMFLGREKKHRDNGYFAKK